jgi:hypothetical protein
MSKLSLGDTLVRAFEEYWKRSAPRGKRRRKTAARIPETQIELDGLQIEIRDYKAAVKFMRVLFKQQSCAQHLHLKRDHQDVRHRAAYKDCPALPCVADRNDLLKVEAVIEQYEMPGDPIGTRPHD